MVERERVEGFVEFFVLKMRELSFFSHDPILNKLFIFFFFNCSVLFFYFIF